jgi:cytochrome c
VAPRAEVRHNRTIAGEKALQTCSDDEVYAVTAYLLHLNGLIGAQDAMNAQTWPPVQMPNREPCILAYPTPPP